MSEPLRSASARSRSTMEPTMVLAATRLDVFGVGAFFTGCFGVGALGAGAGLAGAAAGAGAGFGAGFGASGSSMNSMPGGGVSFRGGVASATGFSAAGSTQVFSWLSLSPSAASGDQTLASGTDFRASMTLGGRRRRWCADCGPSGFSGRASGLSGLAAGGASSRVWKRSRLSTTSPESRTSVERDRLAMMAIQ